MMQERRERIYSLPEREMIDFLRMYDRVPEMITVPMAAGLPKDARVIGCWPDQSRRAIQILVESETFDIVPDGERAPDGWPFELEMKAFQLYPPTFATLTEMSDAEHKKMVREFQERYGGCDHQLMMPCCKDVEITISEPTDVDSMNIDQLRKLREQINVRLFDLERQPAM